MALCQKGAALRTCSQFLFPTATASKQAAGQRQPAPLSPPTCHACILETSQLKFISSPLTSSYVLSGHLNLSNNTKPQGFFTGRSSHKVLRVVNRAAEGLQDVSSERPPSSREEAVTQARTALQSVMVKHLAKQGRRKGGMASQLRLQVEVPVADDSPETQVQLARDVCDGAFSDKKGASLGVAIFVATDQARTVAEKELQSIGGAPVASVHCLKEGETFPDNAGAVLLIGPKEEQIFHLRSIVGTAGSRPIVLLNPEWPGASEVDESNKSFVESFDVLYSFLPLNVQAMLSKFEGALLKFVRSGPPKGAPWVIFVKGEDGLKPVKTYSDRPTAKDLEDIFYNYSASQSPVNKSIGFLRGLVGKGKK